MHICVVGLGNIGFNLLTYLVERFPGEVTGVDINRQRIEMIQELGFKVTSDYQMLNAIDTWVLTPSTGNQGQTIFAVLDEMLIHPGALISIESTLPPGTMERVKNYLGQKGLILGRDCFLIHVPHRVMFGVDKTVCDTPRVMGAFTEACLEKGRQFYGPLVPNLIEVEEVRIAELCKVVENVKRFIDIAFAQEMYRYCVNQGINFQGLRQAVNSKENVELLSPDWGIGGECLPKDMGFLRMVFNSPLLEGAEQGDLTYRNEIIRRVGSGRRVLVKGLSYKPGLKDLEHSRGVDLVRRLEECGNSVVVEEALFTADELIAKGFTPFEPTSENEKQGACSTREMPDVILERNKALEGIILPG
ncbi:nucleotide sugar dehydrogenase [Desulfosporosinus sp. Tol-M]|jgi:UDP-N-acetyl-D-mannosaminuronate dehydrogenase|nr:nucleotide sugar dehydrogenase [Desulfosporosinus sp. Tol-M]